MPIKKSVVILGGGISGLAAARDLTRRGLSVTLVEAQDRLGGRIRTIRSADVPIELGPEFVHGQNKALLETLSEAGLPTQTVTDKNRLFKAGQFQDFDLWGRSGEIFKRIKLQQPDVTFAEFLASQPDLDELARSSTLHYVEGFNAAHASRISAHALLLAERAAERMNGSDQFRVTPGYSALVDFMVQEITALGGTMIKSAPARHLAWQHGSVNVGIERNQKPEVLRADAAILTLPVGMLKSDEIKFDPPIPQKLAAARALEFGNVVKIIFQFSHTFWDDFGFVHALDKPIPTWWNDPRGPLVVGWAGGPTADALLGCSRLQLEEMGLATLGQLLAVPRRLLRDRLVASHYWNWAEDPHIRGAYSYIPVHGTDLPHLLAAPIAGTLFFAGEATVADAQTGTVFGALESGLRAAREVLDSN